MLNRCAFFNQVIMSCHAHFTLLIIVGLLQTYNHNINHTVYTHHYHHDGQQCSRWLPPPSPLSMSTAWLLCRSFWQRCVLARGNPGPAYWILCHKQVGYPELGGKPQLLAQGGNAHTRARTRTRTHRHKPSSFPRIPSSLVYTQTDYKLLIIPAGT